MSVAGPRGSGPKRGPAILVTDSREQIRPKARPMVQRQGTRIISVDNVLQYASEIPSAQKRERDRPRIHTRTPSGRHPLDPKLSGRGVPLSGGAATTAATTYLPARSSKTSEKLVLLPEAGEKAEKEGFDEEDEDEDDEAPPNDDELRKRREGQSRRGKSDAERLPKSQRLADPQLARVTAYCPAQSFRLKSTALFVREQHGAKTKLYDDVLYCVYQLPLLGGQDGFRVRSSPVVKNPGGRSVLDEQIEANEQRQYREGWIGESDEYSVRGNEGYGEHAAPTTPERDGDRRYHDVQEQNHELSGDTNGDGSKSPYANAGWNGEETDPMDRHNSNASSTGNLSGFPSPSPTPPINANAYSVAELYIFSYGVAVFWNFTANQEKDLLADLTFSSQPSPSSTTSRSKDSKLTLAASASSAIPLMTQPLPEDEFEQESFHFQYFPHSTSSTKSIADSQPTRIYNDMITLRTADHMVKLAISHTIAQSTKLSYFEEKMQRTMSEAQYVPRRLALEGRLGMTRKEVVMLTGRLFQVRVEVNLSSGVLDTPPFFWSSEPTLAPLYSATRDYLEIRPRTQVLNERNQVFLDLGQFLADSIGDGKMTRITWIIIVLIVVSIMVTCSEVVLRFSILADEGRAANGAGDGAVQGMGMSMDKIAIAGTLQAAAPFGALKTGTAILTRRLKRRHHTGSLGAASPSPVAGTGQFTCPDWMDCVPKSGFEMPAELDQ